MSRKISGLSYDRHKVTQETLSYWENVLRLIGCAGRYRAKIALRDNLRDQSASFKVQPVFEKYHAGSMEDLYKASRDAKRDFNGRVDRINKILSRHEDLPQIQEPARLLELLQEKERRDYYNREARKLLSQNEIMPLQKLEDNFKKRQQKKQQGQAKA